jgi:hypothetical protein
MRAASISSSDLPLVSGILHNMKKNPTKAIDAKMKNVAASPIFSNSQRKNKGMIKLDNPLKKPAIEIAFALN